MATTPENRTVRDISTPERCAARLQTMLTEFTEIVNAQEKLSRAIAWYQLRRRRSRLNGTPKVISKAGKREAKAKPMALSASPSKVKPVCGEHFAGQLKAQDPRTSRVFIYSFGDTCRFRHEDISSWTMAKKRDAAASLMQRFRQPSLDAIGKINEGKTRV